MVQFCDSQEGKRWRKLRSLIRLEFFRSDGEVEDIRPTSCLLYGREGHFEGGFEVVGLRLRLHLQRLGIRTYTLL
jgi:hypothetical protein